MQNKPIGLVIVCGLAAMLGCQNDEIRSYRVPKQEATRLLAVIIPHGDQTWFFKLMGPMTQVDEQKEAFDQFIRSLRFTDNAERPITWMVPNGWRDGPQAEMRYATFYVGPYPLELSVSKFGGAAGSVLLNVNRWRGQIGLGEIQESQLSQIAKGLQLDCGPATLVDMTSWSGGAVAATPAPDILSRRSATPPRLQYDKPESWKEKADPKKVRVAVFEIADGAAEAGVSAFSGLAGGLLANVNRWRDQLHLDPIDEKQIGKDVRPLEVAGMTAHYVDLTGPEAAGQTPQRMLGVVLPRGEQTWFFTLKGPADVVEKQKSVFEAFVKSVRFDGGKGS